MDTTRPAAPRPAAVDTASSPASTGVDAVLQARAVHELIGNDPRMPPKLRMLLVLYAGDLLERAGRSVELTPLGLAALAAAGEAGPHATAPALTPAPSGETRRPPGPTCRRPVAPEPSDRRRFGRGRGAARDHRGDDL
jgi:hypothetical protein